MSWQDRDYAQRTTRGGGIGVGGIVGSHSVVKILIVANVVVFVLCLMTSQPSGLRSASNPIVGFGELDPRSVFRGQIWRLVTSQYLHGGMLHIMFNMLALYFLGPVLEARWGGKRFFAFYTLSGVIGSLFYLALTLVGWLDPIPAIGASGCVLGVLGAVATLYPRVTVYINFLLPMQIRTLAILLGGWYVINIWMTGHNAGGDACHLAGLLFGVWWARAGYRWWDTTGHRILKPRNMGVGREFSDVGFKARMDQRRADADTVDRILAKVHTQGIDSLSAEERRELAEATERQRREDYVHGRTDRL